MQNNPCVINTAQITNESILTMKKIITLLTIVAASASFAHADTVTSLVGDQDGFNQGLVADDAVDHSVLESQPGEDANTDTWVHGTQSWTHTYDVSSLSSLTGATVTLLIGGLGWDGAAQLYLGDQWIGELSDGDDAGPDYNYAKMDAFDLTPYLSLLTGSSVFTIQAPASGDGWSLDYSLLEITGMGNDTGNAVPEGSTTLVLFGAALIGFATLKRRTV